MVSAIMSKKKAFIPELPCENTVRGYFGDGWRYLPYIEINGALGIAIVKSILDGVKSDIREMSSHLGVDTERLRQPFTMLNLNGAFLHDKIPNDKKVLNANDKHAWGYYAGMASGHVGAVVPRNEQ